MQSIRNISIIAHVDHGKSTLVDSLLRQSNTNLGKFKDQEMVMDWSDLERERGITIFSKNASVVFKETKINIIDTPGHADFGGEVERVLNMADGSLLLVDAQEGPMPQTRFVLKKALEAKHKIILIINKIDKPNARPHYALEKVLELFIELGATNEQLDFPVVYAAGKLGVAGLTPDLATMKDMTPLLESIITHIPSPNQIIDAPFQMMIVSLAYDNFKGRIGIGRVRAGSIEIGKEIARISPKGEITKHKLNSLMSFEGLVRADAKILYSGDIGSIAGIDELNIGDTLADAENPQILPAIRIEEPTVKMTFGVNNSPMNGKEGQYGTSRNIKERLEKELLNDVAIRVEQGKTPDEFIVSGRGELHLAILIEKMRREDYELQVSRPEVIFKIENGKELEPFEEVWLEVPEKYSGMVIERMGKRKGELRHMSVENNLASFYFIVPTRGLIGFRNEFLIDTKGAGVLNTLFHEYALKRSDIETNPHGSLIAYEPGDTTSYAILGAQERGVLFIGPGENVYEGQIVGENAKDMDLVVNVCKVKQLNNFRAKTEAVSDNLIPPRRLSLEQALEYIGEDELVEVTPKSVRLRKRVLKNSVRK